MARAGQNYDLAPYSYKDLARLFDLSVDKVKRRMRGWEERGFPVPLPWCRREKYWNAEAVLAWKAREELRSGARGTPDLQLVSSR